ncbi:GGDEF domain-containing response regulator [Thioalkalivibrio thiocyanoxidans]|uniref:GGDEF domain-containing response regulator n=1 Tax=Thioalkalivibrio thiocyanoxidans TaxID=152475 RepID=UPI00035E2E29|nr:diguanylate cyclase [Thioalkalivibrio thiocyanoxidans]
MRILVVDRSRVFRALWSRMVGAAGHEASMAGTGAEGLARLEIFRAQLACVALNLPDMDGLAFCREARKKRYGQGLPLIILTSNPDRRIRERAFAVGATDVHDRTNIGDLFQQAERYAQPLEHLHSARILYVEDSPTAARYLHRALEPMGLDIVHYTSAAAALAAFEPSQFDLVLTDILVEGDLSGMGLVGHIRQQCPDMTAMPIVAMSGLDDQHRRAELFRLGVNDFITKPFQGDELRARLCNLLNNKRLVEEVRLQRQKHYELAMVDPLTGLSNRNALTDFASRYVDDPCSREQPLALILMDLDHFKAINDRHGHLIGDEVLAAIGELLRAVAAPGEVPIRFGGEELLMLMPGSDLFDAHTRAEDLRQRIQDLRPAGLPLTASFGVTSREPGSNAELNDLFRAADEAVYNAKARGRNCVVSVPAQPDESAEQQFG